MTPSYPPAQGKDRTTLWGVLGIIFGAFCCGVLGLLFGYLSIRDAKRFAGSQVIGWIAIGLSVANIISGAILGAVHPLWRF